MKKLLLLGLIILLNLRATSQTIEYINGNWFTGNDFVWKTWYSHGDKLTQVKPNKIDLVVDLRNCFVVPPFGEAHNHNVAEKSVKSFTLLRDKYLRAGIFYVKNPNSLRNDKKVLNERKWINHPKSIDATFAGGGITATGGHPSLFFANTSNGEGNFFHLIDTKEELEKKWRSVLANDPDFIKIFLLFSEEYASRKNASEYKGHYGLDPQLVPFIVDKAHQNGLRVTAHVETGYDFHIAIEAGVDEIAHMPGFRGDPKLGIEMPTNFKTCFAISDNDAHAAAKKGTVVITTLGDIVTVPRIFALRRAGDILHAQNLRKLKEAGVKIVLGSDSYEKNSLIEINYLKNLKVFSNIELLKLLCEATPQSIFPGRKIGQFTEGYEASFLALKQNPIQNISGIQSIFIAVKQGAKLEIEF